MRGRTAKLLPLALLTRQTYSIQHLRFFYLQVIDLHGILCIESLEAASPLASARPKEAGRNRRKNLFTLLLPNNLAAALSTEGLLHGLHFVWTAARVRCAELLPRQNWWRLHTHLS